MAVKFSLKPVGENMVLLEFVLDSPLAPADLKRLSPPEPPHGKIILISGRGPTWLYGYLLHEYVHKAKAIAFYDPKIPGYVVVASHVPEYREGDVIHG